MLIGLCGGKECFFPQFVADSNIGQAFVLENGLSPNISLSIMASPTSSSAEAAQTGIV
jgi:hypothetical protein